jgi:hypothetical protein
MAGDEPTAPTGTADQAQRFRDATEKVRQRTELTAKTLGGLGITAVSAIGIAKFADIFPWAPDQGWWVALLIVSFLLMIGVVGLFTYRLWHANERILLRSDVDRMNDLSDEEKDTVREVYAETARLNLAPSLRALEARAQRLYRIATRTDNKDLAKQLRQRADDIAADIRSVQARAGMIVVRRRAGQAIRDALAIAAFAVLALSIVGFGVSSDRLDSERTQLTKIVKDCAEAKKAAQIGGVQELPRICEGSTVAVPEPPAEKTQCCLAPVQVDPSVTPAKGTSARVQAASEAIRAAASLATTLAPLATTLPSEGPKILEEFLMQVGFPLAKDGISRVASTLWTRFADRDPPRLPTAAGGQQATQPINLTVVLRDARSPSQIVRIPPQPLIIDWTGRPQRPQIIKLTVVVRDRRPRTQIIRVPVDP